MISDDVDLNFNNVRFFENAVFREQIDRHHHSQYCIKGVCVEYTVFILCNRTFMTQSECEAGNEQKFTWVAETLTSLKIMGNNKSEDVKMH